MEKSNEKSIVKGEGDDVEETQQHSSGVNQESISLRPQTMYGSMKATSTSNTTTTSTTTSNISHNHTNTNTTATTSTMNAWNHNTTTNNNKTNEKRATFASLLKNNTNIDGQEIQQLQQHQQQSGQGGQMGQLGHSGQSGQSGVKTKGFSRGTGVGIGGGGGRSNSSSTRINQSQHQKQTVINSTGTGSTGGGNNTNTNAGMIGNHIKLPPSKQYHYTREELLHYHKTTSLPSTLPSDHGIPVLSDVCLPPVCSDAWKPEEIYKQWESTLQQRGTSGGRGRGRGRGQGGQMQNRNNEQDEGLTRGHHEHNDTNEYNEQQHHEKAKDLWDDVTAKDGENINEAASLGNFVEATELFRREMEKMKKENPSQFMAEESQISGQFDDTAEEQTPDDLWDAPVASASGEQDAKLDHFKEMKKIHEEEKVETPKEKSSLQAPDPQQPKSPLNMPNDLNSRLQGPIINNPFQLGPGSTYNQIGSLSSGTRPLLSVGLDLVGGQQQMHRPTVPTPPIEEVSEWYYLDPQGNEQGPFKSDEMRGWYEAGYFKPNLPLRRGPSGSFKALKIHFPDESKSFQPQKHVELSFPSRMDPLIAAALQPQLYNDPSAEHRIDNLLNKEQLLRPSTVQNESKDLLPNAKFQDNSMQNISPLSRLQISPKQEASLKMSHDMFSQMNKMSSPKGKAYEEPNQPKTWASIQKPHAPDLLEIQRQEEHSLLQKVLQKQTLPLDPNAQVLENADEIKETLTTQKQTLSSTPKSPKKTQSNKAKEPSKAPTNAHDQNKQSGKSPNPPQYTKNDLENMGQHLKKMLGVGIAGNEAATAPAAAPAQSSSTPRAAWNSTQGSRPRALRDILAEEEAAAKKALNQASTSKPGGSPWLNVVAGPHQTRATSLIPSAVSSTVASSAMRRAGEAEEDKQFWDVDRSQQTSQSTTRKNSDRGSCSSSLDILGKSPALQEFMLWCNRQVESLGKTIDPTVIQFCYNLEDPGEIRECFAVGLGSTPKVSAFATEFIERKKVVRHSKKSDKTGGSSTTTTGTPAGAGRKKKGKNKRT